MIGKQGVPESSNVSPLCTRYTLKMPSELRHPPNSDHWQVVTSSQDTTMVFLKSLEVENLE